MIALNKLVGLLLIVASAVVLFTLVPKAYNDGKKHALTVKYTCFGRCQGELPDQSVRDLIGFETLQEENEQRKLRVEVMRKNTLSN